MGGSGGIARHPSTRPATRGTAPTTALWWLALGAICTNALLFAVKAANPLVVADGWHFLDAIVMPYAHGELAFGDLFLKRGAMDHSQPLRKLILLAHYEWFDLDYSVEAVIGACAGIANLGLYWLLVASRRDRVPPAPALRVAFLALAAAYLSLNASVVFSWPLLALNYTSHTFLLAFFAAAWWALHGDATGRRAVVVALAGFVLGVVADDTGTIAALALALAAGLHGWRSRAWPRAGVVAGAGLAGQAVYLVFYRFVAPPVGGAASLGEMVPALASRIGEWWQWLAVPLSASVAHRSQVQAWLGHDMAGWWPSLAAAVLLLAHLWFWWRAFAGRRNAAAFVATCQMLLFYGLLAGMLLARVSQHGSDYLWQPRYVLIYQWNLVALLLMAIAQLPPASPGATAPRPRGAGAATVAVALLVLALQVPLSLHSWDVLPHAKRFQQRQAMQMRQLAETPDRVPLRCVHTLVVCRHPEARRAALMGFLRDQRLSVFAPGFAGRHPQLAVDPEARGAGARRR